MHCRRDAPLEHDAHLAGIGSHPMVSEAIDRRRTIGVVRETLSSVITMVGRRRGATTSSANVRFLAFPARSQGRSRRRAQGRFDAFAEAWVSDGYLGY